MIKLTKGCHWHKKLDNPILELWHPMFRSSTSIVYLKVNYYTIIMVLLIMFEMQKLDQAWEQNRGSWAELLILQAHLRLFLCKPWLKCRLSCLVGCVIAWDSWRASWHISLFWQYLAIKKLASGQSAASTIFPSMGSMYLPDWSGVWKSWFYSIRDFGGVLQQNGPWVISD